jgi:hypothetical protein
MFVAVSRTADLANVMTNSADKLLDHSNLIFNDGRNPHRTRYEDLLGEIPTSQSTIDYIDNSIAVVDARVTTLENELDQAIIDLQGIINYRTLGISISGGGNPIVTGIKGYLSIPYACEILSWYIVADTVGSIEIDVWNSNTIPNGGNSITGVDKPRLVSTQENQNETLTTWSINLLQGDVMAFNVISANTVTFVNLVIKVKLTI